MVEDGIGILKVGPGLTYALREGLVALELVESALCPVMDLQPCGFSQALEHAMLENPKYWEKQYRGNAMDQKFQRVYSYYDRFRYYLSHPAVEAAIQGLLQNLRGIQIPLTLLSQYMPLCCARCREGDIAPEAEVLLRECIRNPLRGYPYAVGDRGTRIKRDMVYSS